MIAALVIPAARAAAYEQPSYEVVEKDGAYELRSYEPYVVAETTATGESKQASNEAFMRLFRYISGKNRKQVRPDDPKIAMTVPVTIQYNGDSTRMTFMVPGKYTLETAPQPADPQVELRAEPGGLVAALTYSGRSSQERYREREELLESWVTSNGLQGTGELLFAQYSGPFTPWFLRRNEVLLPVTQLIETVD
jgi:hypothetical protein